MTVLGSCPGTGIYGQFKPGQDPRIVIDITHPAIRQSTGHHYNTHRERHTEVDAKNKTKKRIGRTTIERGNI